jgi:hypothetical protein
MSSRLMSRVVAASTALALLPGTAFATGGETYQKALFDAGIPATMFGVDGVRKLKGLGRGDLRQPHPDGPDGAAVTGFTLL